MLGARLLAGTGPPLTAAAPAAPPGPPAGRWLRWPDSGRASPPPPAQGGAAIPDIRYVCLSDLHFGAENSVLTSIRPGSVEVDPHGAMPTMDALVECLAELVGRNEGARKPTLVLCGDVLELALATDNVAAMVFERFIDRVFPPNGRLFDDTILFVAGNHDHHLWESARERQYADYVASRPLDQDLEIPWHTTHMFLGDGDRPVDALLLTTLVRRRPHLQDVRVRAVYPNLGLTSPDGSRHVAIHHGHFVEGMYRLMSSLKTMLFPERKAPQTPWDWEAENFAWIDFFWSTLGRSGEVGTDVGIIYASLQSDAALQRLSHNLAKGISSKLSGPAAWRWGEDKVISFALGKAVGRVGRLERNQPTIALSDRARAGLLTYLEGPLRNQLLAEKDSVPTRVTFVFGHTHKPFETQLRPGGYPGTVDVYNTGGWVVDSRSVAPLHGGAAILLDENLDVASLRLYNQAADPSSYRVGLAVADPAADNPFLARLTSLVRPDEPPWSMFSAAAATVVDQRHRDLDVLLQATATDPAAGGPDEVPAAG
ncbi:MAG: metallophosphoesterase [Acidimicrobiales bacterium]